LSAYEALICDRRTLITTKNSGDEVASCHRKWHRSILLPLLRLSPPTEGFPWDDLRKISHGGQRMAKVQMAKNMAKSFNPLSRANELYRRICNSKDPNV